MKKYLLSPPVLDAPRPVLERKEVLFRDDDGIQKPVFFVSKSFTDVETSYMASEKLILALHETRKKLFHSFQGRKAVVFTPFPIHNLLSKLKFAGRIGRWALPLALLDIEFIGRSSTKGQVLTDFFFWHHNLQGNKNCL